MRLRLRSGLRLSLHPRRRLCLNLSGDARVKAINDFADMANLLSFDERQKWRRDDLWRKWFAAMTEKEKLDFILDGGQTPMGLESTVIGFDHETPVLLRPGALAREDIEAVVGPLAKANGSIQSPGQLETHYAPNAALRLNIRVPEKDEVLLGFGPCAFATLNLSPAGDLREAAANLFAMLRALDQDTQRIAVAPIPETGLGEAINDRLRRAAAPRT